MLTLGIITYESLRSSDQQRSIANDVASISEDIVTLITLESELTIELYWAGAHAAIESVGLDNGVVEQILGFDADETYAAAGADVDAQLAIELNHPLTEAEQLLETIERGRSITLMGGLSGQEVSEPYYESVDILSAEVAARLSELDRTASKLTGDSGVVRAADDLALATELRDHLTDTASHFFALRFPDQSTLEGVGRLLTEAYIRHEDAADRFMAGVTNGRRMHHEVHADPAVDAFLTAVSDTVRIITDIDGLEAPIATDPIAEFGLFQNSIFAVERHVELVDATAEALDVEAQAVVDQANNGRNATALRAALLALAALLFAGVATRWIVQPLRSIAERAGRILDGDLHDGGQSAGLREIRDAELALDQAANNIRIAERQATALAEANLDAEVLSMPTKGRLDTALRSAFDRLRASIAEREEYRERLRHEAEHDPLTGLPNRPAILRTLDRSLERAGASDAHIAVLFIDVDRFKRINDQQGHAAGDHVLRSVSHRIMDAVGHTDHVGRLAGDEFVVVTDTITGSDEALAIARRIQAAVTAPLEVGTAWLAPSVSIGVAMSDTEDDPDELLRDADLAVYRAKTAASSGVELCNAGLRAELAHRSEVEARLLSALHDDRLELHFQPIVNAVTAQPTGFEALLRWLGPDGMSPGAFIPIAERSDLIIEVDRWVIDRAVRQLAMWGEHPQLADAIVAVNISARNISTADVATTVFDALDRHGVDSHRLIIEITESALLDDVEHAAHELVRLRERGIKIALDDFGTGHTSLSHLRELPVDILKLDREFVVAAEADRDRPLARLIIEAGHLVGAVVVAEGVETPEQAELMQLLGADEMQGYLFGYPTPPEQLAVLTTPALTPAGE